MRSKNRKPRTSTLSRDVRVIDAAYGLVLGNFDGLSGDENVLIRRGEIIGERAGGEPKSEAEHYMRCDECGGYFDMRDLGQVFEHEGPLPHPTQDLPDDAERIHPDSRFGVGA